jgi:uncharacterized protein YraI
LKSGARFLLFFSVFLLVARYLVDNSNLAVSVSRVDVFSGPKKVFQKIGFIPAAREMSVKGESGDFFKIKYRDQIGWVSKSSVVKVWDLS